MRRYKQEFPLIAVLALASLGACTSVQGSFVAVRKASIVDARSIWNPSPAALMALRSLDPNARTRDALVTIMAEYGATQQAVALAKLLPGEPAYLSKLNNDGYLDGFKVGEIWRPFRKKDQKSFVMLNGQPPIVVASDGDLLRNIQLAPGDTLKTLGTSPDEVRCSWAQPLSYDAGPGVIRAGTSFEILYPITSVKSGEVVGIAHVFFNFAYPHWRFIGTSLDYIEKGMPSESLEIGGR